MHLETQNVPEIIKNHLFYYMKMNRRFFASNAFLIDFGTHFRFKMEYFFVVGAPLFASKSHSWPQLGPVGVIL